MMKISLKFFTGLMMLNLVFPWSAVTAGEDLVILSDKSPAAMTTSSVEAVQETLAIVQNSLELPSGDLGGLIDQTPVANIESGEPPKEKEDGPVSNGDGGMINTPVTVETTKTGFYDVPDVQDAPADTERIVSIDNLGNGLARGEKVLVSPFACRGQFATFLVYDAEQDWQRNPENYYFNRAFECGAAAEPRLFDFSSLEPGAYVFLRAEQDESGSWRAPVILAKFRKL